MLLYNRMNIILNTINYIFGCVSIREIGDHFIFRQNARHCISPYAIVVCVCVCLFVCLSVCVCVCRVCGLQENGLR